MTKLESIEHKIFASEAPLDEIGQFGSALDTTKLNTKDVTTIQALPAYTKGWGSAIISDNDYPTMEEMNGVLNVMSYHTGYLYQEGMPAWRSDREYSATSIVKEPTGTKFFRSLKDGNIGNTLDNTEYWEELKFGGSGLELCDIGTALYVDETKGLRRRLNGSIMDITSNYQAFLTRLLEIKTTNPDYFTDEATWQSEATLNVDGCVYKFVLNYDSTGTNVVSVRLPKYPDYVEVSAGSSVTKAPVTGFVLGSVDSGIVNLPALARSSSWDGKYSLNSNGKYRGFTLFAQDGSGNVSVRDSFNGSQWKVDAQADLSNLKLKNTKLKLYYFIQIATGQETEANITNKFENTNPQTLLESKYSDKPLYNESWLLSNGQYNLKATYPTAYEGLQVEYNSEIEAGTTVTLPSGVSYTKRGLSVKLSTETYTDYDFVLNTADEKFRLPLKTKLASGKVVIGNGTSIGLTDGTNNFSMGVVSDVGLVPKAPYGGAVGSSVSFTNHKNATLVGVTTDPTKSGIELSDSGLYLYYYVGDLDQNHGIVNMGRIGEQLANKVDRGNKQEIVSWGMPDYSATIIPTSPFVAPCNGYLFALFGSGQNLTMTITQPNGKSYTFETFGTYQMDMSNVFYPIAKGYTVVSNFPNTKYFYPCIGG